MTWESLLHPLPRNGRCEAGTMNLTWIAALTVMVLAEKILPFGSAISKLLGAVAMLGGAWFLLSQ